MWASWWWVILNLLIILRRFHPGCSKLLQEYKLICLCLQETSIDHVCGSSWKGLHSNDCPQHSLMSCLLHHKQTASDYPPGNYCKLSHLGKKNDMFKSALGGDIFVPRRVVSWSLFPYSLLKDLQQDRVYMMCLILSSVADGVLRKGTNVISTMQTYDNDAEVVGLHFSSRESQEQHLKKIRFATKNKFICSFFDVYSYV